MAVLWGKPSELLRAIPMLGLDVISRFAQPLAHIFGDHDGTMLPAGASERHRQIAFSFADVVWH